MTKKDYEKIAACLASNRTTYVTCKDMWHKTVNDFVDMLKADNPRFNPAKFIEACEK